MTFNISDSKIGPPSYELKTSDKGWFMQIGFRDSVTVHHFGASTDGPRARTAITWSMLFITSLIVIGRP